MIGPPGGAKAGPAHWTALLRQIPSVEEVLNRPAIRELAEGKGRRFVTERVRFSAAEDNCPDTLTLAE